MTHMSRHTFCCRCGWVVSLIQVCVGKGRVGRCMLLCCSIAQQVSCVPSAACVRSLNDNRLFTLSHGMPLKLRSVAVLRCRLCPCVCFRP